MKPFKTIISYFWPHIIKYKKSFFFTFVFYGLATIISGSIVPLYYKEIIDVISLGDTFQNKENLLMSLFVKLALFILSYNLFFRTADFLMVFCQTGILRDLRNYSFDKVTEHSYVFFANNFAGGLVAKMKRFVMAFENIHDSVVFIFWMIGVKLLSIIAILFWMMPILGLVFSIWCVAYVLMTIYLIKKKVKYDLASAEDDSLVTARLSDVISNILNIKLFTSKEKEYESFTALSEKERMDQAKSWKMNNVIFACQGFFLMALEITGMYFVIRLWLNSVVSAGFVVLIQIYLGGIFASIWHLGRAIATFYKALSNASEMIEIFEKTPDIVDVNGGTIKIDGQNIATLRQFDLRNNIAYIPQDTILFHRTLKENIAYGNDQATDEEIIEASKKAHAYEFISSFPNGYDTLVGERGVKLSGGERQRVAIARAMLKKAPILILDEATSSLDTISEKYIQDSFEQLIKGRTTIVIAHRLSTVQKMDRIIVLEKGKIAEEGKHKELLDKGGIHSDLWKYQTNGFLE